MSQDIRGQLSNQERIDMNIERYKEINLPSKYGVKGMLLDTASCPVHYPHNQEWWLAITSQLMTRMLCLSLWCIVIRSLKGKSAAKSHLLSLQWLYPILTLSARHGRQEALRHVTLMMSTASVANSWGTSVHIIFSHSEGSISFSFPVVFGRKTSRKCFSSEVLNHSKCLFYWQQPCSSSFCVQNSGPYSIIVKTTQSPNSPKTTTWCSCCSGEAPWGGKCIKQDYL